MARVEWTEPALNDLDQIAEYIAISNPYAAKKLVQGIFSKIERLETFPESGRIPQEIESLPYREVIINPCRVFYKIELDTIYILHVLRQERDLRQYLLTTTSEDN